MYKEQLRAEPEEGSKGAGLGFMEIARRASKPIEFDFTDVDEVRIFRPQGEHMRAERGEKGRNSKPLPHASGDASISPKIT